MQDWTRMDKNGQEWTRMERNGKEWTFPWGVLLDNSFYHQLH